MKPNENIQQELKELSPLLAKLREKEEGYKVPRDYFTCLSDEIMAQCKPEVATPVTPTVWEQMQVLFSTFFQPRYAVGLATCVLLLVGFALFIPRENSTTIAEESISQEEIMAYITENIDDFELELLSVSEDNGLGLDDVIEIKETDFDRYIDEQVIDNLDETILEELL